MQNQIQNDQILAAEALAHRNAAIGMQRALILQHQASRATTFIRDRVTNAVLFTLPAQISTFWPLNDPIMLRHYYGVTSFSNNNKPWIRHDYRTTPPTTYLGENFLRDARIVRNFAHRKPDETYEWVRKTQRPLDRAKPFRLGRGGPVVYVYPIAYNPMWPRYCPFPAPVLPADISGEEGARPLPEAYTMHFLCRPAAPLEAVYQPEGTVVVKDEEGVVGGEGSVGVVRERLQRVRDERERAEMAAAAAAAAATTAADVVEEGGVVWGEVKIVDENGREIELEVMSQEELEREDMMLLLGA